MIYNAEELEKIYRTGRGSVKIRARYNYDKDQNCIEITEIPPTTTVEAIIDKIGELIKAAKIREISDVRDETDLSGLKLTIDLKRGIDADKLITDMLAQMLSGNSGSGNNENGDGNGTGADRETAAATFTAAKTSALFIGTGEASGETAGSGGSSGETTGSGEADSTQALKNSLTQAINEKIGGQMNTFLLVMKITGGVILFTLFTWAYIVLKILCKAATANPVVKLKLPIWLGWLPFLILYAVPTGVIKLAGSASAETAAMFAGMNFSFFTCGVISALAVLALIIVWMPYHRLTQRD